MTNLDKAHEILEKALAEWRKQQTLKRERISIEEFASFLGYSQPTVNLWLNKDRKIGESALSKMAPKIAELLGNEIYKILELPMPEENLVYIENNWEKLSLEEKREIKKMIERKIKKYG